MSKKRVAINGFGRIGRLVLRSYLESGRDDLEFVAINDLAPAEMNAHLLEFDTVHGRYNKGDVTLSDGNLNVGGQSIQFCSERNPEDLPWDSLNVDIVMECTGIFNDKDAASPQSPGRRQTRSRLSPLHQRRSNSRLRRQRPEARSRSHRRLQRVMHNQLPCTDRPGTEQLNRYRTWLHDHDPFLHRRPTHR